MYKFSIITPTYNRAHLLKNIYNCLVVQAEMDIEWIVIDDGSTDGTGNVVSEFEKTFEINYIYQGNAGKPTAVNKGVSEARGLITIILDDDDVFVENALSVIWNKFDAEKRLFAGDCQAFSGLCIDKHTNTIIGDIFPRNNYITDFYSMGYGKTKYGDKCHVFCTHILKQFPYPIFDGEYFITEAVVYNRMGQDNQKVLCVNSILKKVEYLQGGLSSKYYKIMTENSKGSELYYNEASAIVTSTPPPPHYLILNQIRASAIYIKFAKINKQRNIFQNAKNKILFPLGLTAYYLIKLYRILKKNINSPS